MNEDNKAVVAESQAEAASLPKYVAGFVGSIALTLIAYLLVTRTTYSRTAIVTVLAVLAVTQFVLQMVLFLHVGTERRPRWKLLVTVFMLGIVLLVVFGSLWIMNNLNYRMTPVQQEQYLKSQDAL